MSVMLITHDLGVVASMADRVIVMYAGKIAESAPVRDIFKNPLHPYTHGLLNSIPQLDVQKELLHVISGTVPNLLYLPTGCRFNPRCPNATDKCRETEPTVQDAGNGHLVSCWHPVTEARG